MIYTYSKKYKRDTSNMQIELKKTQRIINWATRKIYYEDGKNINEVDC